MRNNLFPPSIIAYAEVKNMDTVLVAAKQENQTNEEYIHYLTHKVNNVKHETGRIYMKIDESGCLFANSVSPFSETFWENIEPKIKPLVKILVDKRYLPYSSCEGHGFTFRRYVGLAFADEQSRQYVADFILKFKIPGVKLKFSNSVANQKINVSYKKTVKYEEKFDPEESDQREAEAATFNIQFHRNYNEYFFMEIIILEAIEFGYGALKTPFKSVWLWYMKKYHWEKLTERLVVALNSDNFKKYKY